MKAWTGWPISSKTRSESQEALIAPPTPHIPVVSLPQSYPFLPIASVARALGIMSACPKKSLASPSSLPHLLALSTDMTSP
jgi:hypothetical protein